MNPPEPPEQRLTIRNRIRIAMTDALPPGTRKYDAARFALEVYRQTRDTSSALLEFQRSRRVSHTRRFSYRDWFEATHLTPRGSDEVSSVDRPSIRPHPTTVVVLPGPGPVGRTLESLDRQTVPPGSVMDRHDADDGMDALAQVIDACRDRSFVVCLVAGDVVEPDMIARLVDAVDTDPRAHLVTWDDDVVSGTSSTDPSFHPTTYSPDVLLSANPHGRSFAVRGDVASAAGGLRSELGTDALWDLLLRLDLDPQRVVHIPRVLVHLVERMPSVGPHGVRVVSDHLRRVGLAASAHRSFGAIHLVWDPPSQTRVSVLVPSRHNESLLGPLIQSLRNTRHENWELIIVDNGERTPEHEAFYERHCHGIDHHVLWWDEPFNYGAVNNAAAELASGDVLVLLNDDTVVRSPDWLAELTGWLSVPGVGTVGVQLVDPEGLIQHGGVLIGATGLADHRFQGMQRHSDTILGSTDWYHDSIANTGACVAITKDLWETIGGLDEKFTLCGSDVVLGIDVHKLGLRNVCTPAIHIDHLESATRETTVPAGDVFASYWRYARFLRSGDPFHNPNVSLLSREPSLRAPDEPSALTRVGPALGRSFGGAFQQTASEEQARSFAQACRATSTVVSEVVDLHRRNAEAIDVRSVNWFVPDFDNPFYGGLATIFRIADHLRVHNGVDNRFIVWGRPDERWTRSGLAAVFPGLEESEIVITGGLDRNSVRDLPAADVSIATQWQTAYQVAHFPNTRRKFYLIQDFEPMFNPAGTLYALAEETYKLGLIGLCNTPHLLDLYRDRYGGSGYAFTPAVDRAVFHADDRPSRSADDPLELFVYARPGHWRNCWELAEPALRELKDRFGDRIRIVTAGAWTSPSDMKCGMDHLGLLDYADTGALYRTCDIGLSLTVSEHPSYLPLELMACGVPVVAFDLPAGYWVLRDGHNSLLAKRTVDGLVEQLTRMVEDDDLRGRLAAGAVSTIAENHDSWSENLSSVHDALGARLDMVTPRSD